MKRVRDLLSTLVATPSQAGVDDLSVVARTVSAWLKAHGVPHTLLGPPERPVAVVVNPPPGRGEQVLVLNACLDTAPVGDRRQWSVDPFGAEVKDGWLHGRGSSDSKAAVAIFCDLARSVTLNAKASGKPAKRVARITPGIPDTPLCDGEPPRQVTMVFDCDEHSGRFGGIHAYLKAHGFPAMCVIGYPGLDEIVAGSRGFLRTTVILAGEMGHSGAARPQRELAAVKLAALVQAIERFNAAPATTRADFPHGPRATLTHVRSGVKSFSVTPPRIECALDIRTTPDFDAHAAQRWLDQTLAGIDRKAAGGHATRHTSRSARPSSWPPYRTPDDALLPQLMRAAAARHLGHAPPMSVSGPSNIGNVLAGGGAQVLCGFGVRFRGLHGPDECVDLSTLAPVHAVYRDMVDLFLAGRPQGTPPQP
ncbi:MAG: M20/M25/M40 family metallo-hydrolase [Betaproteobacteria bacterium]|jgi:succinyl-diaminopimelate desuccinylase